MNCRKCGSPLMENDQFCKNCGATVNDVNAPMVAEQSAPVTQPNVGVNTNNIMGTTMGVGAMPQQPTPMNNYNVQPQKKNNTTIIVAAIIGVAILAAAIIIGVFVIGNNGKNTNTEKSEINTPTEPDTPVEPTKTTSTYTVKNNGFTFKIPDNLVYESASDSLMIGDEEETWVAVFIPIEGNYSTIAKAKNQVKANVEKSGFDVEKMEEQNINGVDALVLEIVSAGETTLLGYAEANSMYVIGFEIYDVNGEANYDALDIVGSIIASAEYNGESNSIAPDAGLNLGNVLEGIE